MRSTILKTLGGIALATAVVWALVLGWWQANNFQPSKSELLLYLFVLPFSLVGGFLLLHGFIENLKAPPKKEEAKKEIKDEDPLASAKAKTSAAERAFSVCLIGAWINTPAGKSAAEILENIDAGARPEPSDQRQDEDGFPLFLAEVKDLDIDQLTEALASTNKSLAKNTQTVRLLALIESILPETKSQTHALLEKAPATARLRIHWLLPSSIENTLFSAMRSWLNDKLMSEIDNNRFEITIKSIANEADALKQIDDVILQVNREKLDDDLILVIAATSAVDEESIQTLSMRKQLFSATNQSGQIPGESAVSLLFSSPKVATSDGIDDAVVITRVSHASRDKPVTGAGRINGTLIEQLADGILTIHAQEASDIQALISDSDHRANNICELQAGLGKKFEHLDAMKDCLATGAVTGTNQPAGSLLALVCAREKVLMTKGPALCISNQHDTERAVLLAIPFIDPLSAKTANT
jgi:hypothetical protein